MHPKTEADSMEAEVCHGEACRSSAILPISRRVVRVPKSKLLGLRILAGSDALSTLLHNRVTRLAGRGFLSLTVFNSLWTCDKLHVTRDTALVAGNPRQS